LCYEKNYGLKFRSVISFRAKRRFAIPCHPPKKEARIERLALLRAQKLFFLGTNVDKDTKSPFQNKNK
jgi:hypothetical protein